MNETLGAYTLFVRGLLATLLAAGGIYALNRGFNLFRLGLGEKKDDASVEFGRFKASSKTIGSFVMITACVWGLLGYLTVPGLNIGKDTLKISKRESHERGDESNILLAKQQLFLAKQRSYERLLVSLDACTSQLVLLARPNDQEVLRRLRAESKYRVSPDEPDLPPGVAVASNVEFIAILSEFESGSYVIESFLDTSARRQFRELAGAFIKESNMIANGISGRPLTDDKLRSTLASLSSQKRQIADFANNNLFSA